MPAQRSRPGRRRGHSSSPQLAARVKQSLDICFAPHLADRDLVLLCARQQRAGAHAAATDQHTTGSRTLSRASLFTPGAAVAFVTSARPCFSSLPAAPSSSQPHSSALKRIASRPTASVSYAAALTSPLSVMFPSVPCNSACKTCCHSKKKTQKAHQRYGSEGPTRGPWMDLRCTTGLSAHG